LVLYGDKVPLQPVTVVTVPSLSTTADPPPAFRVAATIAREVDFVFIRQIMPWYMFGLSTPPNTHHTISHVTIGTNVYYADRTTPYHPASSSVDASSSATSPPDTSHRPPLWGYRRRRLRRAHSH